MSTENITITAKRPFTPPDDDFHIYVGGRELMNWTSLGINRSLEQLPGNFSISVAPAVSDIPTLLEAVHAKQTITFYVKKKLLFTGIIEQVHAENGQDHALALQGRSILRNLFDCSSQLPGYVSTYGDIDGLASALCNPFGVKTYVKTGSTEATTSQQQQLQTMNMNAGETPFAILQRAARVYGKILMESTSGSLVICDVTSGNPSTDFNTTTSPVLSQSFDLDISGRFATYEVMTQPNAPYASTATVNAPTGLAHDPQQDLVGSERAQILINSMDSPDHTFAQTLAQWQANRNYGRSMVYRANVTGFTDASDNLWDLNTLVRVTDPYCGLENAVFLVVALSISRSNEQGSVTSLTMMPREAMSVEPNVINPSADYYSKQS